jgi:hypothetical protein
MKKTIKYNNKNYKLPFAVALPKDPNELETISNRFTGQKAILPKFAVAVYDVIMGSELLQDWKSHRQGLDWFQTNFTNEYYVLLD